VAAIEPPETIICVDCGGVCHLLSVRDDADAREPGDPGGDTVIAAYRCSDCLDRWDIELSDDD
jgi:hypothetical protein